MNKNFLPISIDIVHEAQIDCLSIEGTMLQNFGPWRKDDKKCLIFDFEHGTITELDDNGEIIIGISFCLVPND